MPVTIIINVIFQISRPIAAPVNQPIAVAACTINSETPCVLQILLHVLPETWFTLAKMRLIVETKELTIKNDKDYSVPQWLAR